MKRTVAFLLALVMLIGLFPIPAAATETEGEEPPRFITQINSDEAIESDVIYSDDPVLFQSTFRRFCDEKENIFYDIFFRVPHDIVWMPVRVLPSR